MISKVDGVTGLYSVDSLKTIYYDILSKLVINLDVFY